MFMKAITEANPWDRDSALNRTIWQNLPTASKESMTIGVVDDYSSYTLHPPVRRALDDAVEKLKAAGVKVVPVTLPDVQQNHDQLFEFFRAAGNGVSPSHPFRPTPSTSRLTPRT
jgi:amidase